MRRTTRCATAGAAEPQIPAGRTAGRPASATWRHAPRDFITFEYCMLDGVNDQPAQAQELVALVRGQPARVPALQVQPDPLQPVPGSPACALAARTRAGLRQVLQDAGIVTTVRKTRGDDIDAACGQLAGEVQGPHPHRDADPVIPRPTRRDQGDPETMRLSVLGDSAGARGGCGPAGGLHLAWRGCANKPRPAGFRQGNDILTESDRSERSPPAARVSGWSSRSAISSRASNIALDELKQACRSDPNFPMPTTCGA
jgi:hypothetical protein